MNPTITALDTNRNTDPSRRNPAASITTPVNTDSVNNARAGSRAPCTAGTPATIIDIAPVAWTAMNDELVTNPPVIVPTKYAYKPASGFTPARRPAASPSGTLCTPSTKPATLSARTVPVLMGNRLPTYPAP